MFFPLPILIATTAYKAAKAKNKHKKAKKIQRRASAYYEETTAIYNRCIASFEEKFTNLENLRISTSAGVLRDFVDIVSPIIHFSQQEQEELRGWAIPKHTIKEIRISSIKAKDILSLGLESYILTIPFGLPLGPIGMTLTSFKAHKKAKKAYKRTVEYSANVEIACEKMRLHKGLIQAIEIHIEDISSVIHKLTEKLQNHINSIQSHNITNQEFLYQAYMLAKTLSDVVHTQIFDEEYQILDCFLNNMKHAHNHIH